MEYYDSINKEELHQFYFEKCNKLHHHPKVIEVLDKNSVNFTEYEDINLFKNDPYKTINSSIKNTQGNHKKRKSLSTSDLPNSIQHSKTLITKSEQNFTNEITLKKCVTVRNNKFKLSNTQNQQELKNKIQVEFNNLDLKFNKINENIKKVISEQTSRFEEFKKRKLEHQKSMKEIFLTKSNRNEEIKTNYSSVASNNEDDYSKDDILKTKEKSIDNSNMLKDIEAYIEKNMKEMNLEIDEIKLSFEEEINSIDEDMFPDVVKGLKEDMKFELKNLKDHYEDKRRCEVEKIKAKYHKFYV